ncbi:MAG: immunity 51 family protein [Fusobacteriaceae bacterium]|nr:immunity 51 family protein [Fusobacteriaceae bacterium]
MFKLHENEGFCGNGYDWESLVKEFIKEKCPKITSKIYFDPEMGLFCAY